jgi:hypothetical protein
MGRFSAPKGIRCFATGVLGLGTALADNPVEVSVPRRALGALLPLEEAKMAEIETGTVFQCPEGH